MAGLRVDWIDTGVVWNDTAVYWLPVPTYIEIPPEVEAMLINPYADGPFIWLVRLKIPPYALLRYAKNTEDFRYAGHVYLENNLKIKHQKITSDGSIPRSTLKIMHDADHTIEDMINATEGATGGTIRLIKVHRDFPDIIIDKFIYYNEILQVKSNETHVTFTLGIPSPLRSEIPLRNYSSKVCPWGANKYKGVECGAISAFSTCDGLYSSCIERDNGPRWGAILGLSSNSLKV